jgi:pilus assembly protein CpaC
MQPTLRLILAGCLAGAGLLPAMDGRAWSQERLLAQLPPDPQDRSFLSNTPPPQIAALPNATANMRVIQRRSQLIVARSNILRTAIADSGIVDVVQYSPNELAIIGVGLGSTTVTLWFVDNPEPLIYLVEVIRDPNIEERQRIDYGNLERKLAQLFPNSRVHLIPFSQKIVVKGQAKDSEEAARILSIVRGEVINQNGSLAGPQPDAIGGGFGLNDPTSTFGASDLASGYIVNMLEVPGEYQVALRVRIAELKRSMLRRMGVNFDMLINDGQLFFSSVLAGTPATLTGIFSSGDVNVLVNVLASNGTAKILAEPNITVLSGHPASFLSGGEFAVPTIVGIGGVGGQQTTFRGFGVSLVVVPTIIDKDLVRMQILPEFSSINSQNSVQGIPGVNTRRVQTTVELREGQTIALAGLLSSQMDTEVTRIPFLGEIPIVGPLIFNGKRATNDETELLILVTPEIVRPLEADEVPPLPGHEVTVPNDHELYFNAQTEGAPNQGVYQLAPYGSGNNYGIPVGYSNYNPAPASSGYAPEPSNPLGAGTGPNSRYPITPGPRRPAPGANSYPPGAYGPGAAPYQQPLAPIPNPNLPANRSAPSGPTAGRFQPAQPGMSRGNSSGNVLPAAGIQQPSYTIPTGMDSRSAVTRPRGYSGGRY